MKTLVILLCLVFCITPAFAQWETHATVTVPFQFVVGNTIFPAGEYAVLTRSADNGINLWNADTGVSAFVLHRNIMLNPPGSTISETTLVFRRDGDRHVLHQIKLVEDNHVHDLVHGTEVLELAQAN